MEAMFLATAAIIVVAVLLARRRPVIAFVFLVAGFLATPAIVAAQDAAPIGTEDVGSEYIIAAPTWTVITGLLLPIVIGFITKANASKSFQAIVGILVAAVGAIVVRATTVDGAAVFDQALILDATLVYVPQIASYLGFWKNLDLNQKMAPNVGLG